MARDDDVKIYTFEAATEADILSESEEAAARYMRHKEQGNLEKTRRLGETLAEELCRCAAALREDPYARQKLVLAAFLARDVLESGVDDLILQKSAAAAMQKRLEEAAPEIADTVRDSTGFTMYILNDRQRGARTPGAVLADLCGRKDDAELAAQGDLLADELRRLFTRYVEDCAFA